MQLKLYKTATWGQKKVAVVKRWSLWRGFKQETEHGDR